MLDTLWIYGNNPEPNAKGRVKKKNMARGVGLPVGRRSGGQLATTLVATKPDPEPDACYNLNSKIDT